MKLKTCPWEPHCNGMAVETWQKEKDENGNS